MGGQVRSFCIGSSSTQGTAVPCKIGPIVFTFFLKLVPANLTNYLDERRSLYYYSFVHIYCRTGVRKNFVSYSAYVVYDIPSRTITVANNGNIFREF